MSTPVPLITAVQRQESDAWRKVHARESGKHFLTEYQIKVRTGVPPARIRAMVDRYRAMRRAGFASDQIPDDDFWKARLMPLTVPTTNETPATAD